MCVSCGCSTPSENHGDPRNITVQQIEDAASAATERKGSPVSTLQVVANMSYWVSGIQNNQSEED